MKNQSRDGEKLSAVYHEIEASNKYIIDGLISLKNQNSVVSNNHVALQLLASGIERLVKILLLLKDKQLDGKFPDLINAKKRFTNYDSGHGIKKMLTELIEYSDSLKPWQTHPMLVEGVQYLKSDDRFNSFISILSEFAQSQRYFYIDAIILDHPNEKKNPFELFKSLIWSFKEVVDTSELSYKEEEQELIKSMIICIEKGIMAISRFFTHGLGSDGKRHYADFSNFILLNDRDLGKLRYAHPKLDASDNYKPINIISIRFLKLLIFSRSKVIRKLDVDQWSFTVDSVTVYNLGHPFYLARIGNQVFALNSKSVNYFKIPVYSKSHLLKPKGYAIFLLEEARKLRDM